MPISIVVTVVLVVLVGTSVMYELVRKGDSNTGEQNADPLGEEAGLDLSDFGITADKHYFGSDFEGPRKVIEAALGDKGRNRLQ